MYRFFLFLIICSLSPFAFASDHVDERLLQKHRIETSTPQLLEYLRQYLPNEARKKQIEAWIADLDSTHVEKRQAASAELVKAGTMALAPLREYAASAPLEPKRRAEKCLKELEGVQYTHHEILGAVTRTLVKRRESQAGELLWKLLPVLPEEPIQETLLSAITRLWVGPDAFATPLDTALKNPDVKTRRWAVQIVGQAGFPRHRTRVRALLEDPEASIRQTAAESLLGKRSIQNFFESRKADEDLLRKNNLETSEEALITFFRQRSLKNDDDGPIAQFIRELGAKEFSARKNSSKELLRIGAPAMLFLKQAMGDPDVEIARRALHCLEDLRAGPGPGLPSAAARLLARADFAQPRDPRAAIAALIDYVPYADDENVEDEVTAALGILGVQKSSVDSAFASALHSKMAARRAASAKVLGQVGLDDSIEGVRQAAKDAVPIVRFRALQGLLAAHAPDAIPGLIRIVPELPDHLHWTAEEVLFRLAEDQMPAESSFGKTPAQQAKAVKAWETWWQQNRDRVDLGRAHDGGSFLGLITVTEYDSPQGQPTGQVWEASRNGEPRFRISQLHGAMDAQTLPNGNVLIAENNTMRVTERDPQGNIVWEHRILTGQPIAVQRLPNGNTFIGSYNQVMEITPNKETVYRHQPGPDFYVFSAVRTRSGLIVAMTAQGVLWEMDAMTGREIRKIPIGQGGGWSSVEPLPGGNYLVASMNGNQIREIDNAGNTLWSANFPGVFRASKMPNGNVLAVSMTTRKVAEIDRTGAIRWEKTCQGRPWNAHWR